MNECVLKKCSRSVYLAFNIHMITYINCVSMVQSSISDGLQLQNHKD